MLSGVFGTPKPKVRGADVKEEDLEYVWLGDVDTGYYATVFGSPGYQEAVKAYVKGEQVEPPATTDVEEFLEQYTQNGRRIASLIKTGFLGAQEYAVLDNSAPTRKAIREAGGGQGLATLQILSTPRTARMTRSLADSEADGKEETEAAKGPKLEDFQPGVQTYLWALDHAKTKRQRTRMRRRYLAASREWELRYDAYLRHGGKPFQGRRTDARTLELCSEEVPIEGKAYLERDQVVSYWYDEILGNWNRMVGIPTAPVLRRGLALKANKAPAGTAAASSEIKKDNRRLYQYSKLDNQEKDKLYKCLDVDGNYSLYQHQRWLEPKYPLPGNRGLCNGLCSFKDGWLLPEGLSDGLPTDLDLAFTEHGDPLPTHVFCAACKVQLCRKCYNTMKMLHTPEEGGGNLTRFLMIYSLFRKYKRKSPTNVGSYIDFVLENIPVELNKVPREDPSRSANEDVIPMNKLEEPLKAREEPGTKQKQPDILLSTMVDMRRQTLAEMELEDMELARLGDQKAGGTLAESEQVTTEDQEAVERLRREAEEEKRQEAEEKKRQEAEERKRQKAEEKQRREAKERQRREAQERQRREEEEKQRLESEERQRQEEEERQRREAEEMEIEQTPPPSYVPVEPVRRLRHPIPDRSRPRAGRFRARARRATGLFSP